MCSAIAHLTLFSEVSPQDSPHGLLAFCHYILEMQSFTNSTWTVNDQVAQPDSDSMGNHGTASGKVKKRRGKARATDDDELNEMEEQMREMELDYDASEEVSNLSTQEADEAVIAAVEADCPGRRPR